MLNGRHRRAWMIKGVRLQSGSSDAALVGGQGFARLHLAHLTFEKHLTFKAGEEDAALAHLKAHLSWRVQRGRDTCAGVGKRGARARQCSRAGAAA